MPMAVPREGLLMAVSVRSGRRARRATYSLVLSWTSDTPLAAASIPRPLPVLFLLHILGGRAWAMKTCSPKRTRPSQIRESVYQPSLSADQLESLGLPTLTESQDESTYSSDNSARGYPLCTGTAN